MSRPERTFSRSSDISSICAPTLTRHLQRSVLRRQREFIGLGLIDSGLRSTSRRKINARCKSRRTIRLRQRHVTKAVASPPIRRTHRRKLRGQDAGRTEIIKDTRLKDTDVASSASALAGACRAGAYARRHEGSASKPAEGDKRTSRPRTSQNVANGNAGRRPAEVPTHSNQPRDTTRAGSHR